MQDRAHTKDEGVETRTRTTSFHIHRIRKDIASQVTALANDVRLGYTARDRAIIFTSHIVFLARYVMVALFYLVSRGAKHPIDAVGDLYTAWRTSFFKEFKVCYHGVIFRVRPHTVDIFNFIGEAEEVISHCESIARAMPDGMFVDVGANIGVVTIVIAKSLGPKGKVISIEPEPDNFERLNANVRLNGCTNITALKLACSSRDYMGTLFTPMNRRRTGSYSLGNSIYELSHQFITVEVRRLDGLLSSLGIDKIDAMKIDVDGIEADVLLGAGDYLRECKEIIFESCNADYLAACSRALAGFPYEITQIGRENYTATAQKRQTWRG